MNKKKRRKKENGMQSKKKKKKRNERKVLVNGRTHSEWLRLGTIVILTMHKRSGAWNSWKNKRQKKAAERIDETKKRTKMFRIRRRKLSQSIYMIGTCNEHERVDRASSRVHLRMHFSAFDK